MDSQLDPSPFHPLGYDSGSRISMPSSFSASSARLRISQVMFSSTSAGSKLPLSLVYVSWESLEEPAF
ncbi:hypothetical protein PsYK624_067560 [Phanerochaete sordida]|uniref:Uncharacterized protein n=1 Tax=Phanerochaete sordida TaxID=48140 RepID=A0A9P3LE54_9APHY|nr:hypothetical protein PsYK624_067560 [Phanerochaete sordida]